MITIGVDFHKRTSSYCVLDASGNKSKCCKLENSSDNIREFINSIPGPKQLAIEATRNWGLYYDTVADLVDTFYLGHPLKMKAITESETKNDQKDADVIARLTQSGFLPTAHTSCLDTRQLRGLLRFRHFLVNQRRSIRNQVQVLIDRNFFPADLPGSFKDFFCRRGLQWLKTVSISQRERVILDSCIATYQELSEKINNLEHFIATEPVHLSGMNWLRTVPGFKLSKINVFIVLLEADDISRFKKARGFVHYAGLVPREHSSGDKHHTGRLVKQANMFLRTAFIESALAAIRADKRLRAYYASVKERAGSSAAIIATARKLAFATYHVLKEHKPYCCELLIPPATAYELQTVSSI